MVDKARSAIVLWLRDKSFERSREGDNRDDGVVKEVVG